MENKKKTKKDIRPMCPYCNEMMNPCEFIGYYDGFIFWQCGCSNFPEGTDVHKVKGAYA